MNDNTHTLLLVEVPRTNDKKELSAEQMFAALHGILKPVKAGLFNINSHLKQDHISFEIAAIKKNIYFYIWLPTHLKNFVEGQLYAQYATAQIFEVAQDYSYKDLNQKIVQIIELGLTEDDSLPIKTFPNFEVDPLSGITATLAGLENIEEEMWLQILVRPVDNDWHKKSQKYISKLTSNSLSFTHFIQAPFMTPEDVPNNGDLDEKTKARIRAIEEKNNKLGYQIKIRLVYIGNDAIKANLHMQALIGAFKQFNTIELNGFKQRSSSQDIKHLQDYRLRNFTDEGFILNIEELASVYHLPHTSVETPNIVWASAKTSEPPATLPIPHDYDDKEISCFGITNFRDSNLNFGSLRSDRGRHIYVVGQTGTGKTGLLELLALTDIYQGAGYAIVDPHGDFAINNLNHIPTSRIAEVIYFNPADTEFPIGFNPLEMTDSRQKNNIASDLVGVMKRMFDSWGPRLEYILRFTILALLDNPGSTMLDITRMLTDKNFRKKILANVDDPVVANYWQAEFNALPDRLREESISPVLNKVGAFTSNPTIRNIIGQPTSSFDIRKIMDEGKILILNLSRGLIGEDNANILGAMIITKIQLAAMSRADIADIKDRQPFYLYVDEFQNFATDSFAVILSEARKYGLCLTLANQYISQMSDEVRSAVFGNVGTIASFRVSPDDASFLEKYFAPQFSASDLIQLANRNFAITMTIKGEKVIPFSGRTIQLPTEREDYLNQIIESSRKAYSKPKTIVEQEIKIATSNQSSANSPSNQTQAKPQTKKPSHKPSPDTNKPKKKHSAPTESETNIKKSTLPEAKPVADKKISADETKPSPKINKPERTVSTEKQEAVSQEEQPPKPSKSKQRRNRRRKAKKTENQKTSLNTDKQDQNKPNTNHEEHNTDSYQPTEEDPHKPRHMQEEQYVRNPRKK